MRGPKTFFPPLHVLNAQDIKKGFARALSTYTKKHQLGHNRKTRLLIHTTKWKKTNNNKLYDIYKPDEVKIFFECVQDVPGQGWSAAGSSSTGRSPAPV